MGTHHHREKPCDARDSIKTRNQRVIYQWETAAAIGKTNPRANLDSLIFTTSFPEIVHFLPF